MAKLHMGSVTWITGLSGAGKSTLARALKRRMPECIILDGDELREVLAPMAAGYDGESRRKLAFTYARLADFLARRGLNVIVATISLFHDVHAWNRENLPGYMEVFLDVPLKERVRRDPKGLYAAEKSGSLTHMAGGAEVEIELPLAPHLCFCGEDPIDECVNAICLMRAEMEKADNTQKSTTTDKAETGN